ncbi:MAG: zinc ribbon domain-containing protein [Acidobacteria bacterium]|nr:zinc ribbon domain-containing protein [Acidobacteriota bacterium]
MSPEFCTCGARLPPDALFCHKCGKPQRELLEVRAPEPPAPGPPAPGPAAPALDFRNSIAVRAGLTTGSLAILLSLLFPVAIAPLLLLFGAGFLSTVFYRRRTGQLLTPAAGARIGWITAVLSFLVILVLFAVNLSALALSGRGMAQLREQLRAVTSDPQALRMIESPSWLIAIFVFGLLFSFGIVALVCTAGGALGARLLGRRRG